jgi:hypothetical protein
MKNTVYLIILLFTAGIIFSCKKKKDTVPPPTPPANFQPVTAGSTWTYNSVSSSTATKNYTLTSTGNDSLIDGKAYKIFKNSAGPNEYAYKTGNDYYRYSFFEALNQALDLLYLRENYSVGEKWTQNKNATINGVNGTAILECVVAAKGVTHTVSGKTYADVMDIKINPTFSVNGILLTNNKADIHYYFANNVGFIHSTTDLSVAIPFSSPYNYTGEVKLTASDIK